jgi:hypothetical protein
MSYSRRQLEAFGEMLGDSATRVKAGGRIYGSGGSSSTGGASSMQTTSGVLAPYAAQYGQQLLGQVSALTSQGYTPYQSGQATANGQVAGFTPLQNESFNSAGNMGTSPQLGTASTMSAMAGQNALNSSNAAMGYGQNAANIGSMAGQQAQGLGQNISNQSQYYAGQQANAGQNYANQATNPGAVQQYMNPYLQSSLAPQMQLLAQQQGQQQAANQATATQAGAFGGSREGVQDALQNQANQLAMSNLVGQGYNTAYNNALQNMQFGTTAGLQGLSGAQSGLAGAGLGGGQLGVTGANTAISGQQAGLQGVAGAQSGYSGANTAAGTLGNLGNTQYTQQVGNINLQNTLGAQQQQYQQNLDTTAYQNYLNQEQLPYQNASFFLNAVNGLPTSGSTTSIYSNPSPISVAAGLGTAAIGASKLAGKRGGAVKMASGGLAALAVSKMA